MLELITIIYSILFFFGIYFLMIFILLSTRNRREIIHAPEPKKFLGVSFITPAYNEEDTIEDTLNALVKIDYPKSKKEIIIVNDGSTDNTKKVIERFLKKHKGHNIRLLNKPNSGKAKSLNYAIKRAKKELIAIVDADSCPKSDSLKKMTGWFEKDKKVAAVTSRVLVKNKKKFIERYQDFDYVVIAWDRKILDFIGCVYVTAGPLSVYRKEVIKKIGGFDPKNMTEDIEITWNLLSKEYKTKMAYTAEALTGVPDNFKQWVQQRVRWNLGGLQTIWKYKRFFFRGKTLFGYFIIGYLLLSFFLSLVGFTLLLRYLFVKISNIIWSIPLILKGYNPFLLAEFSIPISILLILALIFFILAIVYYKFVIKTTYHENKSIISVLIYTWVYRTFYIIPLILSIYKLLKRDIGWYTK